MHTLYQEQMRTSLRLSSCGAGPSVDSSFSLFLLTLERDSFLKWACTECVHRTGTLQHHFTLHSTLAHPIPLSTRYLLTRVRSEGEKRPHRMRPLIVSAARSRTWWDQYSRLLTDDTCLHNIQCLCLSIRAE